MEWVFAGGCIGFGTGVVGLIVIYRYDNQRLEKYDGLLFLVLAIGIIIIVSAGIWWIVQGLGSIF